MTNKIDYDVVIVGAGPAGLTAAIYTTRSNLKTLIIDKGAPGGKLLSTWKVDNYPGFKTISGPDLAANFFETVLVNKIDHQHNQVVKVISKNANLQVVQLLDQKTITTKKLIIATGMKWRNPKIANLDEYINKGFHYCAICDGPLYKNQVIAVIGGGNSAVEESIFLTTIAKQVHLFVRDDYFDADSIEVKALKTKTNVFFHMQSEIVKIIGKTKVEKVEYLQKGQTKLLIVQAIFPYIGYLPVSDLVQALGITDPKGFITTDLMMQTKINGIYAIGDIRAKNIRQITTAVADGTIAAKHIANHIQT